MLLAAAAYSTYLMLSLFREGSTGTFTRPFFRYRRNLFCYLIIILYFSHTCTFQFSGHTVVTGVVHFPPRFLPSTFIAHRVQQSHCSSIFYRVLLTHAPALSVSQFVHKIKPQRFYTSMHSAGLELTKLTYTTRLEDNLMRRK